MSLDSVLPLIHGLDYIGLAHFIGGLGFFLFISKRQPPRFFSNVGLAAVFLNGLWLFSAAASMASSFQFSKIWVGVLQTDYGRALLLQCVLLLMAFIAVLFKKFRSAFGIVILLPFLSSFSGHAAALDKYSFFGTLLDYIHFLGVSLWAGSLVYLFLDLGDTSPKTDHAFLITSRFSKMAMACTASLALSGALLAYTLGVEPFHPFGTPYGSIVMLKAFLFILVIAIAAINQQVYLKQWKSEENTIFIRNIRRGIALEWVLILGIFVVAGFLTGMDPPQGG